jgi:hypothetical protein
VAGRRQSPRDRPIDLRGKGERARRAGGGLKSRFDKGRVDESG